ncbi:hypothetical protein [Streptomyces cupreus]|uniref:Uncharacterized protein n=1 Tax=Streptomyces cupreus TaxID=2759956 RepID=A0A7X1MCR8_9ACTN|nr:hypothetical protein [Streptomyces cupreus]MBC2906729.1 hypothetical protein [Streptomyces cupreus]
MAVRLTPQEMMEDLISLALRAGGPGNVSCIVADIQPCSDGTPSYAGTPVVIGAVAENPTDLYAN